MAEGRQETLAPRYPIPAGRYRSELVERRSRFISTADFTPTVEEARAIIDEVRREFADATHNVYAFAIGYGSTVTHGMSDDGEPSGTAGRPTLAVVRGSGLGDVCVVTTRYFGGTKLGTGGLVRAYTQAAQQVLAEMPRSTKVERQTVSLVVPYALYDQVARLVAEHGGKIVEESFTGEVLVRAAFPIDQLPGFEQTIAALTSGRITPRVDEP